MRGGNMSRLLLTDINVELGKKHILKNVSLEVKTGQLISLLGSSGCGKSTLLKTVAGIIEPYSGDVMIDGRSVLGVPVHRRGAVIVFQDLRLFPHMSVAENVEFALKMSGMKKQQYRDKAREQLSKVRLEGLEDRRISQISGGQMQRVALARAFAVNPSVLLLDEPFSSLDEELRLDMGELLLELQRESGLTTVMVTHDTKEAKRLSDAIAYMKDGEIVRYEEDVQCDKP
ncbi:ABC transporter ATP-binding protein [Proteocatella sphenisci]|uniref:ABC transporter ATP-binding protein n=1 Tax=Proteocatella sphenisci TaxID=181070 RepID=UPI0012EB7E13|nr:ABC transporter ATP-binding protein [Proteocatella sphenisci]